VSDPLAVIYQLAGGQQLELLIPPGATAAVVDAGILVMHEDETVSGIVSVRPLHVAPLPKFKGEDDEDAPEDDDKW
jgi:hypothetical protein